MVEQKYFPLYTEEDLREWLPGFQADLREDFYKPDGTRRPSFYVFKHEQKVYGVKDGWADGDEYTVGGKEFGTAEEAAAFFIEHYPQEAKVAADSGEAGLAEEDGQIYLDWKTEFAEWAGENNDGSGLDDSRVKRHSYKKVSQTELESLHLTRKAAQEELDENSYRHQKGAWTFSSAMHMAPDLERLVELVYLLDLDQSTLVFKDVDSDV